MKVLVVVHVFYAEMWPELATCVRCIDEPCDILVTYVEESAVEGARRDLPEATFLRCSNRGFDVWPFLAAVQSVDLGAYDVVVKLHTKRDIAFAGCRFNGCDFGGANWRRQLLAFCATPEAWRRTRARFRCRAVGMVAARDVIVRRRDVASSDARQAFDRAVAELREMGCAEGRPGALQFVAGTMFAVRSEVLRLVLSRGFTEAMFVPSAHRSRHDLEYAHVVERLFGFAVSAAGMRIVPFSGSLLWGRAVKWIRRKFGVG